MEKYQIKIIGVDNVIKELTENAKYWERFGEKEDTKEYREAIKEIKKLLTKPIEISTFSEYISLLDFFENRDICYEIHDSGTTIEIS